MIIAHGKTFLPKNNYITMLRHNFLKATLSSNQPNSLANIPKDSYKDY